MPVTHPHPQRSITESVGARLDLGPVLPPLPAPAVRIPPAQISPADEPNGTVAAGAANAAIGGRGRRRRSSTVAASINAVLDQKGPPPAEARAPSDVRAGPRRLRATGRQRQGAEPHSGAANRTSTTGTAIGAGCARTSTPTCVLLPRSVCPVGSLFKPADSETVGKPRRFPRGPATSWAPFGTFCLPGSQGPRSRLARLTHQSGTAGIAPPRKHLAARRVLLGVK